MSLDDYGWVPLFRKSINSQVFQNEGLWKFWTWCLMKVSYMEQWVVMKTGRGITEIHIMPGQFIFGRKTAAKELKMKPSTVRNRILKLKNMRNLDIQVNTHYSIVTLTNWEFYRKLMKKGTGKLTGNGQATDTYKKDKDEALPFSLGSHYVPTALGYEGISLRRAHPARPTLRQKISFTD